MKPSELTRDNIVDFIGDIIGRRGKESYLGETVTMEQHMLQAAWQAEQDDASDAEIVGALLHDIGHYTNEFGDDYIDQRIDNHHESAGARVLAPFFDPSIVQMVALHVKAKRYLCATNPEYTRELSDASIKTLELQGGPMNEKEIRSFERHKAYKSAVKVRHYDDLAKEPDIKTPPLDHYLQIVQRVLDSTD
ncbi:MAG: HD domain-containing protein [Pseudomonadota bacterium]